MKKINITVFTPTYNRKKKLKECYRSLCEQTSYDFIWLIVDDGSSDNTEKEVSEFKKNSHFQIIYLRQQNHGKWYAVNKAINTCTTDYFLFLDSDDRLAFNAIEVLNEKIKEIDKNNLISGVIGNTYDVKKKSINGTKMPAELKYKSGLELMQKYKFHGDTLRMYKTKLLKENMFPDIVSEKFIPENVIYDKIDANYKLLLINDVLYYCDYLEDGYSKNINKVRHNNPIGYSLGLKSTAEYSVTIKKKITSTILYIIWCLNFKIDFFSTFTNKPLIILLMPISIIFNALKFPKFLFKSILINDN